MRSKAIRKAFCFQVTLKKRFVSLQVLLYRACIELYQVVDSASYSSALTNHQSSMLKAKKNNLPPNVFLSPK